MPDESSFERALALRLGQQLQALRRSTGISQESFAHQVGLSRNHYQLLESGLSDRKERTPANPRLTTLVRIAGALGMTVSELLGRLVGDQPLEAGGRLEVAPADAASTVPETMPTADLSNARKRRR